MNQNKAVFFDRQVEEPWAKAEYGDEERPKLERLLSEAALQPGHRVLEPGCGTGRLSHVLAGEVGPSGLVLAVDISPAMVKACLERVAGHAQVEARCAALEDLDLTPASFDRVICHQVFPHFDDQAQALSIISDLLKPDGLLLIVHFIGAAQINDLHRKAGTAVEKDLLPDRQEMRGLLQAAGFTPATWLDDELGYLLRAQKAYRARYRASGA